MLKKIILKLISAYRKSTFFHSSTLKSLFLSDANCRFQPTCSLYCYQAIKKYGIIKGIFLCLKRVGKCHPWSKGGKDPLV